MCEKKIWKPREGRNLAKMALCTSGETAFQARTVNVKGRDQCTSGVSGGTARKPESSCRYGGAVRREVSERRDSWYRIRVMLNRKHIYCFISPQGKWKIVHMNKTMWPTEPSFKELENLRTLQSWLPVYSRACLEHRKCFCHVQREGGTFADLKWALCLRKGRGKSLGTPWLVEDKQLLLWLSVTVFPQKTGDWWLSQTSDKREA